MRATYHETPVNIQVATDRRNRPDLHTIPRMSDFATVAVRVIAPFRYAPEKIVRGKLVSTDTVRTVEVGEVLADVLLPNAQSWAGSGWVEIIGG